MVAGAVRLRTHRLTKTHEQMKKYHVIPVTHELQWNGSVIKKGSKTLADAHGYESRKEMKDALGLSEFIKLEGEYFASIYFSNVKSFDRLYKAKAACTEGEQVAYMYYGRPRHI